MTRNVIQHDDRLLLLLLYTARQTNPITGQETLRRSAIT
jgi:hypothetical protein